jgi:putative spermidine/putrescine transport system permease protein
MGQCSRREVDGVRSTSLGRAFIIGFFLTYMLVPLLATVAFSFAVRWDRTILPEGLTIEWWQAVTARRAFGQTLVHTIIISLSTMAVCVLLVTPTAYWAHIRVPRAKPLIDLLTTLPFGIPGVVLALALLRTYARFGGAIVYSPGMLILACSVIGLPFMYRPVVNALNAVDIRTLTEAAQTLGAGWGTVLVRVIVPNITAGIVSGALLVFSLVFVEFTLANLLVGARYKTFPIYLVEFTRFDGRQASALAVISFIIAWLTSLALIRFARRAGGVREEAIGAR